MKRILQLCLFLFLTFLTKKELSAQGSYTVSCNPMCYSLPSNTYAAVAAYIGGAPGTAVTLSWSIQSPAGSSATIIPLPGGTPISFTTANIFASGCGVYTLSCIAYDAIGNSLGALNFPNFPGFSCSTGMVMPNNLWVVACPNSAGYSIGNSTVCSSATTAISAVVPGNAVSSFLWSNGTASTSPTSTINVSPQVNTCYSYTAELVTAGQTCAITPTTNVCLSVQDISATLTPASQTMCAGSPVTFTALTNLTGTNNTPGTTITSYSWSSPCPQTFTTASNTTNMTACAGVYTVYITHTGAAGNCVTTATANVVIGTSVSMSITPSSPSVCPNSQVTLTAITSPTIGNAFTWTAKSFTGLAIASGTGNPKTFTTGGVGNFPWSYTVDVLYGGCPGTAIFTLGILQLTPTITPSTFSMCPGTAITFTAKGAVNYTFGVNPGSGGNITPIGTPPSSVIVYTVPSTPNFLPAQFVVSADSAGCVGSSSITISTRTLVPRLSLSQMSVVPSGSVCPGTQFTLSGHSVGNNTLTPTTYTFYSFFGGTVIGTAGQTNSFVIYNPGTPNPTSYPQTYTMVTDSAGCRGSATATVNILTMHPQLTVSAASVCPGTSVSITSTNTGAGTTYSYYANDFTASSPPLNYSMIIAPTSVNHVEHLPSFPSGTVPVTYSVHVDSAGCVGDGTINVGRLDLANTLTLTSSPANNLICPTTSLYNNTFSLMVTGNSQYGSPTYTYVGPSLSNVIYTGTSTITQVPSPGTIGAGVTYSVVVKDSTCYGLITLTMHELKLHPTISITPTLVCAGLPVTVTAAGVNGGTTTPSGVVNYSFYSSVPPATYSPISLGFGTASVSTTHSPIAITNYSVAVDSSGCTGVSPGPTTSVAIRPTLSLTPSASQLSVCPGLSSTLNVTGPVGNTSLTYTWTAPANGGSLAPNNPVASQTAVAYPIVPTTYSVHAIDSLGCIGDTVITISMDPGLSFTMGLANSGSTLCVGQSATLSASTNVETLGGTGTITYTWSPTTGLNPLNGVGQSVVATISPSMIASIIYTVVASNPYGCVSTNTITLPINQFPAPTLVPFPSTTICPGFTSTLTAFGAVSYTWSGPGTFTTPVAQQSVAVQTPGQYTLVASNGGGCITTTFITVTQGQTLTIGVSQSSQTTCIANNFPKFSQAVHLTASGASSYVWFPYDPLHMTYSLGPQTDVSPAASTCYTVVGSTSVCSGSAAVCVTVIPQYTIEVTPPQPALCLGDSLEMKIVNIGTSAFGPESSFTYSWTEALNAPPISLTEYFTRNTVGFPQNTTTYTVEMKDQRGCVCMPRLVTVTVFPKPITAIAIPTINSVATNTVCFVGKNPGAPDVTINLIGHNMNPALPFGVVPSYTWISPYLPKYNSILTSEFSSAIIVAAPSRLLNDSPIAVYTLVTGYYGFKGCKRIDTVSIRAVDCRPVRDVYFNTVEPNDTTCTRNCITFVNTTDTAAGGPQELTWEFKGGNPTTSTEQEPTVCYNLPGKYSVVLRVKNPYPKITNDGSAPGSQVARGINAFVNVTDVPNVTIVTPGQLRSDTTIRFGDNIHLNGSGALSYEWSPAYNISSLTKPKVTVNPFKTTQYILTGYNSKSCFSSDTINVIVIEDCGEMYVPNAFTPNNDGANDVLYVRGRCLQSLTFMVFNRWGEKVFETTDQNVGWDGTYKGQDMGTAVFVFRLEGKTYDGQAYTMKGNVTLIR